MKRRGFNLVEVLLVMTVGSVVLGTTVTLLYTIMRAERSARNELQRRAVLGRLADQFRSDAHAALRCGPLESAAEQKEPAGWQFDLPDGVAVVYQAGPDGMVRTQQVGQSVRQRESYALPAETTARIEVQTGAAPTLASLLIVPAAAAAASQPAATRIEAVLARDYRFARQQEP